MKQEVYAIIQTGGKQYKVAPGAQVEVDFLNAGEGKAVDLEQVLFIADGKQHLIGTPTLEDAVVKAICTEESKAEKVIVFKYKNKVRYRRKKGHRQLYSKLQIKDIVKPGGKTVSAVKKTKASSGGNA
jgi:large subunit ribosomal protein L21